MREYEIMSIFDLLPEDDEMRIKYAPKKSTDWKWNMPQDYPPKSGLKVFSCFACGGGSTMGYKLAGCDVLGCCEIDPLMNRIYVKNHHPKYNFLMDIREFNKLPNSKIPKALFNLDILDGSPPCTTFSTAGLREKSWGKKKKFREGQVEQTLDDLSFVFIETVAKLKPRCVIMKNVEGILLGNAIMYCKKIYKDFQDLGYRLKHWLLRGETMGIPQRRHRVFFIAVRNDISFDFDELDMTFNYDLVTYGEIKDGKGLPLNPATQTYKTLCQAVYGDHDLADVYIRLGERARGFTDPIVWDDEVCMTVTAKANIMSGVDKKKISNMDIIHAQTFPENYDFDGTPYGYVCGMSVPPVMIKRIVTRLMECGLFKYKSKKYTRGKQ